MMFAQLIEDVRESLAEPVNLSSKKARQWKAQSAVGGETPSGDFRKVIEPGMKRRGVDIDATKKARDTGKVTSRAVRSVRQLRKFNTPGDLLALKVSRKRKGLPLR